MEPLNEVMGLAATLRSIEPDTIAQFVSAVAAVTVRILIAPARSVRQSIGGAASGLLCAWLMTDPLSQALGLSENTPLVAAGIALIGEQIVRRYIELAESRGFYKLILKKFGIRLDGDGE